MKTCPACKNDFERRSRGGYCPLCKTPLLLIGNTLRITEDKLTIDEFMLRINNHIKERDHVAMPFIEGDNSTERKIAYELLERSKNFLKAQPIKLNIAPREFLLGLLEYILSIKRWAKILNSLKQLYHNIQKLARDYFRELRTQYIVEQAERKRLVTIKQNSIEIRYGI